MGIVTGFYVSEYLSFHFLHEETFRIKNVYDLHTSDYDLKVHCSLRTR